MIINPREPGSAPLCKQYAVNLQQPHFYRVFDWVLANGVPYELHAARLRFRPHSERLLVEYHLQWATICYPVGEPYPTVF